jgi:hypothetical protein
VSTELLVKPPGCRLICVNDQTAGICACCVLNIRVAAGMIEREKPDERARIAEVWHRNLDAQGELCTLLEALADALPDQIDAQESLNLARSIYPTIRRIHVFEEDVLYPILSASPSAAGSLPVTLERLRFEHMEDESLAEEIYDAITDLVAGHDPDRAGMLAYMLRGFFANLNRHVAFEREFLLPLVRGDG